MHTWQTKSSAGCSLQVFRWYGWRATFIAAFTCPPTPKGAPHSALLELLRRVLSLVLLIFGFVSRSVKMFNFFPMVVHVYLRRPISKQAQQVFMWLLGSPKTKTASDPVTHESMSGHSLPPHADILAIGVSYLGDDKTARHGDQLSPVTTSINRKPEHSVKSYHCYSSLLPSGHLPLLSRLTNRVRDHKFLPASSSRPNFVDTWTHNLYHDSWCRRF